MEAKKNQFTDFQWIALLFCVTLGAGVTTLPRTVAEVAGRDAWLSVIMAGLITWVLAAFIWLLCRKFPNRTLPQFSILVLGKPLGILVSVAYGLYALVLAGSVLRVYVELVKTWVMLWTPAPVFVLAVLLPVVYISRMGATTLARLMEIITLLTLVALTLWLVPLGEFNSLNLRPVGGEGLGAIAQGAQETIYSFSGFEIMLVLFPFIRNRKKALRLTILALTIITLLYVGNVVFIHGVLGLEHTLTQQWPLMNYLRVASLPFIQRVDSLMLFLWTAQIIAGVAILYFNSTFIFSTLTRHNYHDIWALVCWPLIYIVTVAPQNLPQVAALSNAITAWGLQALIGLVAVMLVVAKVRGLDEREEETKE